MGSTTFPKSLYFGSNAYDRSQRHRPSPTSSPGRAVFPPKRLKPGCSFSKTCRTSLNAPPPPRSVSQPLGTPPLGLETLAPAVHLLPPGAEFQLCRPFFKDAMFPGSSHSPRALGAWPFLHLPLHHHLGSGPTLPALPYLLFTFCSLCSSSWCGFCHRAGF